MARALSAVERREYVRAVIRITRHQGRLTTTEAMKKLGLSRATVHRYFSEAEATGEVVRHGRLGLFRDQRAVIDFDMKRLACLEGVNSEPAPVVTEKCPAEIRNLIASHSDALFNDDDAQEIWSACRAAMHQVGNSPEAGG
ncbi:hypothetical protein AE02_04379 [Klebsiella variicola]|nr:DUF977 family protein [Klebsiella variicola]KDM00309.1 hypothetical protein AE02_04379 [Klebsiella variicola]